MNTNPTAKRILCYGDSNTWGANPRTGERYPADKRWTGILQQELGNDYTVIEEGLSGRTTMYTDPEKPLKNGKTFFDVCLHTHKPLDLIIIMLGTNDVKIKYNVADEDTSKGIEELIKISQNFLEPDDKMTYPKVLVIAPPVIKPIAAEDDDRMINAPRKSALFAPTYQEIANKYNCSFLNASEYIESSDHDGYHLELDAHEKLGKAIAIQVKQILG